MNISSSFQNISKSKPIQSIKKILPKQIVLPEAVGGIAKRAGNYINTPEQKMFLAASTLMITPLLDLKFADDDKKVDAAVKSASKAIAGGITGVSIRAGFQLMTKKLVGYDAKNKFNVCFFPISAYRLLDIHPELAKAIMEQYCKTMGTLFAVLFMILFSNSNIDVPLTSDLQDLLSGVVKNKKSWIASLADVSTDRKGKIRAWVQKKKNSIISVKNKIVKIANIIMSDEQDTKKQGDK